MVIPPSFLPNSSIFLNSDPLFRGWRQSMYVVVFLELLLLSDFLWAHPVMLRSYSWVCTWWCSVDHMEYSGELNLGWPCLRGESGVGESVRQRNGARSHPSSKKMWCWLHYEKDTVSMWIMSYSQIQPKSFQLWLHPQKQGRGSDWELWFPTDCLNLKWNLERFPDIKGCSFWLIDWVCCACSTQLPLYYPPWLRTYVSFSFCQ